MADRGRSALFVVAGDAADSVTAPELAGWRVEAASLPVQGDDAARRSEEASAAVKPEVLVVIGVALATRDACAGDVVAAARLSGLAGAAGKRRTTRRTLRRLERAAARARGQAGTGVHIAEVAVGSALLAETGELDWGAAAQAFPDAVALDPRGWDFLLSEYGNDSLPVLAVYGIVDELGGQAESRRTAALRAAAGFAARILDVLPPRGADEALDAAAADGEAEHARLDGESLAIERPAGFLRPVAPPPGADAPQPSNGGKERMTKGRFEAYRTGAEKPDGSVILPPDLTIIIRLKDRSLTFELHGAPAYNMRPMGEVLLEGEFGTDPTKYREGLKRRIRQITEKVGPQDEQELRQVGRDIYADLWPEELRREYWKFRDRIGTLLITSEEPWIPWELVHPWTEEGEDDDFLCMKFDMTRWLSGEWPKQRFRISSVALLEAGAVEGQPLLDSARDECLHIAEIATRHTVRNLTPKSKDKAELEQLLAAEDKLVQLWHVAAHGHLDRDDPREAYVVLGDAKHWKAGELRAPQLRTVREVQPLVFFNACLVAHQDFSIGAKLGGWPKAWTIDCRCGAFLGPQWSISSTLAGHFSRAFYTALEDKETKLGEAVRAAREAVRAEAPGNPAWLSYALYGHPNAEVVFVAAPDEAQPS